MRQLTREPVSPAFLRASKDELARAKAHFEGTDAVDGFEFEAYRHPDVKAALWKLAGGGKCAYCEADFDVTQPSDLEHFRPKGGVDIGTGLKKPGYWWLAADWSNLLPSCIRCNRTENVEWFDGPRMSSGKGNSFPLIDESQRATEIGGEASEQPLLIDPCKEDPSVHIRFVEREGDSIAVPVIQDETSISAQRARASIDIYGLNRAGLVRDRSRYLIRAQASLARTFRAIRRLERTPFNDVVSRDEAEMDIKEELNFLAELTNGADRYTGMLTAVIVPELTRVGLSL